MAEDIKNPNTSSSQETDAQTKDNSLTYSEEPCEVSEEMLGDDLTIVPLDEEIAIIPVEDEEILIEGTQEPLLAAEPQEVDEGDVEIPSLAELRSSIMKALNFQEGSREDEEDVSDIEPAAGDEAQVQSEVDAQDVAQIEPEAGDQGGRPGITSSGRGYGFQSSFDAQGVINLDDVGPIDPTALQYGIPETQDKLFYEEEGEKEPGPLDPEARVSPVYVYEDGSATLSAYAAPESANGELTVTISGIPAGWGVSDEAYDASHNVVGTGSYDAVTGTWTITLPAGTTFEGGPVFTPPADSDIDALDLVFTVNETDAATGQSGTTVETFDVIVDAVADQPDVDAQDNSGNEGDSLAVHITGLTGEEVNNGVGSDDGSEHIVQYEIAGLPAGFTISAGTLDPVTGSYILTPAELAGLTVTPDDPNFSGSISLVVTMHTTENPVSDTDFDFNNNNNLDYDLFTLTWGADADKPKLCVDDAYVKEDGSVFVPVEAHLSDTDGSEYLTVTIDGVPASWNFAGAGWVQTGPDSYEIVLSAGVDYAGGFTVSPPADSDVDLSGINVTATATEVSNGDTASVSDGITVFVDAVADVPNLNASGASGEEGTTIPLTITTSVNDTDGSEVIEFVKITNVPSGATLTAGTYNASEDTWYVDYADLAGLGINVPNGMAGSYVLNVESVAYEQNTNALEWDLTDNRASAFDTIKLCVKDDHEPIIKDDKAIVDETDMSPYTSVSDSVYVDFGNDTPGDVSGNGTYDVGGITSEGRPVTVTYDAATDTYTGTAGSEDIFTLLVNSDGSYTFTLMGTLDHPDDTNPNDYVTLDFGVTATDSDGDEANAEIHIRVYDDGPVAVDDTGHFNASEGYYDGNVLPNDTMSQDDDNDVTLISYGSHSEVVPNDGTDVRIDGTYGYLVISNDGEYTYTLFDTTFNPGYTTTSSSLDPVAADVAGLQTSITKDGITVEVANTGNYDLTWVSTADGAGIGIDNLDTSDSTKVYPLGEALDISFAEDADTVTITIGELGDNNDDGKHGLDYVINFADGTTLAGEQQFVASEINNGYFTFTIDSDTYGSEDIASILISSTNAGQFCGASFLLNNVEATYIEQAPVCDEFTYTLTDGDGDDDTAVIKFTVDPPNGDLIVGQNVDDDANSTVPHLVNGDYGVIDGEDGPDILVGDAGGSKDTPQTQDYNFVFILDFSGSMGSTSDANSQVSLMKDAVSNLMQDFSAYQDGEIVVHIVPFATQTLTEATFTITDAGTLAQFETYLDSLSGNSGYTNYEDPMQDAIAWLNGSEPLDGDAITTTYFVSDGEPNKYINANGGISYSDGSLPMDEILGITDGTNEVGALQALSDDVIAVGIKATTTMMDNLDQIDEGGDAINIDDASDLGYVFASTNPITTLDGVGDDVIVGGEGDDLIFGDVLFTDGLADLHGLGTADAAGWEVFERLESGESSIDAGWTREDTVDYILAHTQELAGESVDPQGDGRVGGNDHLYGGAGDDMIFGQEGNDIIVGGEGADVLHGGSGADTFVFDNVGHGVDTVSDFNAGEGDVINLSSVLSGFDPLADDITDFVMATTNGGDTTLYVDVAGSGNMTNMVELVMLEGVTSFDVNHDVDTTAVV